MASAAVLDRIARALMLTDVEREHIFLIGLGRPPEVRYQAAEGVTPRLQRVLDALEFSPAIVRTCTWDVVAWNRAASVVLADYAALPVEQRNVLRLLFGNPHIRERQLDWKSVARFVVAALRADAARAGASNELEALIDELSRTSPEFVQMWSDHDVCSFGEGTKHVRHSGIGMIAMEYSSFAVDGRPDLSMVIHNPATREDADRVRILIECREFMSVNRV